MSEDNVSNSFHERRLNKLEEEHLAHLERVHKYGPLIFKKFNEERGREDRSNDLSELRNGIGDEPLPENVVPIFKPGIETNGYKK